MNWRDFIWAQTRSRGRRFPMRKAKLRSVELPMKENRLIMEIFRSAIVIILLIFFYQLQTQYADTYEHQMRQCHL